MPRLRFGLTGRRPRGPLSGLSVDGRTVSRKLGRRRTDLWDRTVSLPDATEPAEEAARLRPELEATDGWHRNFRGP